MRVLISYGDHWFPWYMRRLAERPANILFVIKNLIPGSGKAGKAGPSRPSPPEGGWMNLQELRTLLDYHYWARDRVLDAAEQLTPDQLTRNLGSSFGSVRDTLAHTYAAEWAWCQRWQGESPSVAAAVRPLSGCRHASCEVGRARIRGPGRSRSHG